ncbi:MAG: 30S ribosomal protein S4 [Planctomycetaceae bacterium]|nr:30S ribosomal protein S4 [Planctomycetaceae bacterium]
MKLFLKGSRCNSDRCAFQRRQTPPGMHGMQSRRSKMTDYGIHLREKQKVKNFYGVLEKQFRKYFDLADRAKGNTGTNLMSILECRLDNVIYRLGFGASRAQSRQLISHGHILVNGNRVNIASYLVRPGDAISLKNKKNIIEMVKASIQETGAHVPEFLVRTDGDIPQGVMLRKPVPEDVSIDVQPQLIVELCSK